MLSDLCPQWLRGLPTSSPEHVQGLHKALASFDYILFRLG